MSSYEPTLMEVSSTLKIGSLIGFFYKNYIDRLGLKGNERVLDYGAGSGVCSKHLAARLEKGGGRLTCVDVSRTWNRVIRETLREYRCVETIVADLAGPSGARELPDAAYDVVFIHFVLHDIPPAERLLVLSRLAGKLVPGGRLYLREPLEPGGLTAEEARRLVLAAGLRQRSGGVERAWFAGELYEGVFVK